MQFLGTPGADRAAEAERASNTNWSRIFSSNQASPMYGKPNFRVSVSGTPASRKPGRALLCGGRHKNRAVQAHEDCGHVSYTIIRKLNEEGAFTPKIPKSHFKAAPVCDTCRAGKSVTAAAPKEASQKASRPNEVIVMDTFGPIKQTSVTGYKHCSLFTCEHSGWTTAEMQTKRKNIDKLLEGYLQTKTPMEGEPAVINILRRRCARI